MTIRDYCKDFTEACDEKRLIIVDSQTHGVLADCKMMIIQNSKTRQHELCTMMHEEFLDAEIIDAIDSQIAITFVINPVLLNSHIPVKVVLTTVSNSYRDSNKDKSECVC